jgi:hypothetical protein
MVRCGNISTAPFSKRIAIDITILGTVLNEENETRAQAD